LLILIFHYLAFPISLFSLFTH